MRIAVLGTGMVGRAHAGRLAELGHEATMGTRDVERAMASTDEARDGTGTLSQWLGRTPDVRHGPGSGRRQRHREGGGPNAIPGGQRLSPRGPHAPASTPFPAGRTGASGPGTATTPPGPA